MKHADLHVHTYFSDSTFSPAEAVELARDNTLAAIAICDHDTVDGIAPSIEAGDRCGVEIIPGIEMTVEKTDAEIHMLGFFIDWKNEEFRKKLKMIQEFRVERVKRMVEKINDLGVGLDPDEVFKLSGKGSIGRMHLAQALMRTGKVKSFREVFEKYIGFMKPCYVSNIKFTPQQAIGLIKNAGGVAVLAHPGILNRDDLLPELVESGLRGIEVYHSDHRPSVIRRYEELARKHKLLMTGGSDCHGLNKSKVLLGSVRIPYDLVELLREEAGKA